MRTISVELFHYEELDAKAQAQARDWFRSSGAHEYPWHQENMMCLTAFCARFNSGVVKYSLGGSDNRDQGVLTSATPSDFRRLKLKDLDREDMPIGYCMDYTLMYAMYDTFKATGSAWLGFQEAVRAFCQAYADDVDAYWGDESVAETIIVNDYEFTNDGRRLALKP